MEIESSNIFDSTAQLIDFIEEIDDIRANTVGPGTRYQYIQKICNFLIWWLPMAFIAIWYMFIDLFALQLNILLLNYETDLLIWCL